ncbi:hypothetical protein DY000_02008396 [Brassica cretica]|uniref:Secreted protein n=1 Tax=Brassica cretica TaxID=69181 RepID=A0ABQ7C1W4_BRACR|nr:hypothetical protein DY000_02008396 [Brassica cretica]
MWLLRYRKKGSALFILISLVTERVKEVSTTVTTSTKLMIYIPSSTTSLTPIASLLPLSDTVEEVTWCSSAPPSIAMMVTSAM